MDGWMDGFWQTSEFATVVESGSATCKLNSITAGAIDGEFVASALVGWAWAKGGFTDAFAAGSRACRLFFSIVRPHHPAQILDRNPLPCRL